MGILTPNMAAQIQPQAIIQFVCFILLTDLSYVHLHWMDGEITQMEQNGIPCPDVEHVCGSMVKVQDREAQDEGSYCQCEGCTDPVWDENDDRAFTWFHQEKRHWQIQYRFCEPIIPRQTCRNNEEVAAVIRTDVAGWTPRIRKLYCRCPNNVYYLQGWNLVENMYWDYHYVCDRDVCHAEEPSGTEDEGDIEDDYIPCVKRYQDKLGERTVGYRFLCSCPDGFTCPTKYEDDNLPEIEGEDNTGPYITGYCVAGVTNKQKRR